MTDSALAVWQTSGRPRSRADTDLYLRHGVALIGPGDTDAVASVVFAHKTTGNWQIFPSGTICGGWTITGSWPITTGMGSRLRAGEFTALGTSFHPMCRARPLDVSAGDWAAVLGQLPTRLRHWMERIQGAGVRGADVVFACLGPALEVFSRYAKVEPADGRAIALAEDLEKIWEVVGRSAPAQGLDTSVAKARNGAAGTVEDDVRLTALFPWTSQSTDGDTADATTEEGVVDALRVLLKAEQERSPDFLRLDNALSALYPRGIEENRFIDPMLLAVPG